MTISDNRSLQKPFGSKKWGLCETFTTIFAFCDLVLLVVAIGLWHRWKRPEEEDGDWTDGMIIGVLVLSLAGSVVKVAHWRPLEFPRRFHPGWEVAWELFMWLLFLGGGASTLTLSSLIDFASPALDDFSGSSGSDCPIGVQWFAATGYYSNIDACPANIVNLRRCQIAGYCIAIVIGVLHFILFVYACVDCERYNKKKLVSYIKTTDFPSDGLELQSNMQCV